MGAAVAAPAGESAATRAVIGALRERACDASRLADRLGIAPPALSTVLCELEVAGRIVLGTDGYTLVAASPLRD
jgi:predicted Rossmann fold nucleotide-binding protein DprA/Smf involved in DNA uptake